MSDVLLDFFSLDGHDYVYSRDGDTVVYVAYRDGSYRARATLTVLDDDLDSFLGAVAALVASTTSTLS